MLIFTLGAFAAGLIRSIIIGALAGFIAGKIMKREGTMLRNILLGFAGSFVGGFGFIGAVIISVVGACIVLFVAGILVG